MADVAYEHDDPPHTPSSHISHIVDSLLPHAAPTMTPTMTPTTHRVFLPLLASGGCSTGWAGPQNVLYQVAHTAILLGLLAPMTTQGLLFFHAALMLGFLLLSTWAWAVLCAPDVFSWNFSFTFINFVHVVLVLYHLRPIKFSDELEDVYESIFLHFNITRYQFKKLTSSEYCSVFTLHQGEAYATQEVTRTDRLSLLINGSAHVTANGQFLHHIQEKQFLDSPEFESTTHGDEKFHVSIIGSSTARYVCWRRAGLEYLFAKEPYLGIVLSHILGRDITNKLYLLNEKLKTENGVRLDIRLPNVSSATLRGVDLRAGSRTARREGETGEGRSGGGKGDGEEEKLYDGEEQRAEEHDTEEDYFLTSTEKSTLMVHGARAHSGVQLQLSNSTQSSN